MIEPYDLGKNNIAEYSQKIQIDDIVRRANKEVKRQILQSQIEVMGLKLNLLTSNTRFNGKRYWFSCPICNNRVGTIYRDPVSLLVGCRNCLKIKYRKQRYKGMLEGADL
ncbi:hypothetical protein HYU92_03600 [Candidatus Curtissbacteria bacterium]|nr:hypothetical protein [Candidatus Curtissbacteria bacterium]